jgi:hypothetical protein
MSRRYEKVRQGDQQALETTLAGNAKTIAEKIKSSPQGDYTEALKLTLDFCPEQDRDARPPEEGHRCTLPLGLSLLGGLPGWIVVCRPVRHLLLTSEKRHRS